MDAGGNGIWKDHFVSFIRGDIVNDNGFVGGIGHIYVDLTIVRVVDRQVLQTRHLTHQVTQIDHFHDLRDIDFQRELFIFRAV